MPLLAFVLLAAFLFEDDDLIALAVAYDGCFERTGAGFAVGKKRIDIDLGTGIGADGRHAKRLAALDRKLLTARFDNCVTHFRVSS